MVEVRTMDEVRATDCSCLGGRDRDRTGLFGVVLIAVIVALALLIMLAVARAASPVEISGQVQDPGQDPLRLTVTYTISGPIGGGTGNGCNVSALVIERQADGGPWQRQDGEIGVPPGAVAGTFVHELPRGHVWQVRVVPKCATGEEGEVSNAIEVDARNNGWNPCGLVIAPVPIAIGVVYVAQRRRRA
jgi:hypothetical protein